MFLILRNWFHFNSQLLLAYGSTKDYENPKSSFFDNFWNISGTYYYLAEPGINLEINLRPNISLCAGISYRFVTGLNENSVYIYQKLMLRIMR
jgi:hypothetical protein